MYQEYYALTKEPFRLTHDSAVCFNHKSFNKAKSYLRYAIHRREGAVLISGGPGSGKSSLIADFLKDTDSSSVVVANVLVNKIDTQSLLPDILDGFGITHGRTDADSHHASLSLLESRLCDIHEEGKQPLLILDEAQHISIKALEELRLLNTVQVNENPLLQFVLVGQNYLRKKILSPTLEQLQQRLVATCSIDYLEERETAGYIVHHLRQAGWTGKNPSFSVAVFEAIHKFSCGVPRWINQICSRLLLHGMAESKQHLDIADLQLVLKDFVKEGLLPAEVRNNATTLFEDMNAKEPTEEPLKSQQLG